MNKALNKALEKGNVGSNLKGFVVLFVLCIILLLLSFYFNNYFFVASIPFSFLFVYAFYITFSKVFSNYNYFKNEIEFLPDGNHFIKAFYNYETLTESVYVLNGKRNGISKILYKNGDVASETVYDNGLKSGNHKEYYESSLLKVDSCYRNNLKDGDLREYYDDGQLKIRRFYIDDKIDGEKEEYFKNGNLKIKEFYKSFQRHGIHNEYYENGQLKTSYGFDKGEQLSAQIYSIDRILLRKSIFIDNRYGDVYEYYDDGSLKLFNNQSKYTFYYPGIITPVVCCEINLIVNASNLNTKYKYSFNDLILNATEVWQEFRNDGAIETKLEFNFDRETIKELLIEEGIKGSYEIDEEIIEGDKYYMDHKKRVINNTDITLKKSSLVKTTNYNDVGDITQVFISEYKIIKSSVRNYHSIYAKDRLLNKEITYDTGMRGPPGMISHRTISFGDITSMYDIIEIEYPHILTLDS